MLTLRGADEENLLMITILAEAYMLKYKLALEAIDEALRIHNFQKKKALI